MKLHLGCGKHVLDGWINIDAAASRGGKPPDIIADLRKIPMPDGCADTAMAIHVIEHFYRWEVPAVLAEWRRLLCPGGILVLECPDVLKCAAELLRNPNSGLDGPKGDQMHMWGVYGDPGHKDPLMCHRWGWHPATLARELKLAGFRNVVTGEKPEWHGSREKRDMRVTAIRPE